MENSVKIVHVPGSIRREDTIIEFNSAGFELKLDACHLLQHTLIEYTLDSSSVDSDCSGPFVGVLRGENGNGEYVVQGVVKKSALKDNSAAQQALVFVKKELVAQIGTASEDNQVKYSTA